VRQRETRKKKRELIKKFLFFKKILRERERERERERYVRKKKRATCDTRSR
jgi:hypothetical protein